MTEKVQIIREDNLPIPLIYLHSPEDLAEWYASALRWSLDHGERALSITCFDTDPAFGFDLNAAAPKVLKAVTDILYDHPEAKSLTIICAGAAAHRAYQFHWNLWYAETKPQHEH